MFPPQCLPDRSASDLRSFVEAGDCEGAAVVVVEVAEKNEGKVSKELKSKSMIGSFILP
jgi:hypothetical protein